LVAQIESLGYAALAAAGASEALDIIEQTAKIDLLFTDTIMPGGMNGRRLVDEALKQRPALKVLYTSGDVVIHQGRLDPGVLLLVKPYRKTELARMIRVALGS
jgi:CheY-like chemotaxis protein